MQQLIKINTDSNGINNVSARELYEQLDYNPAHWKRWYTKNITDNQFAIENTDWVGFTLMVNGNETMDFALTIDFAKKLAMLARTKKGDEVRDYFLECEKQAKQPQQIALPSKKELALMVVQLEEEKEKLEAENKYLAPRAELADKVLSSVDAHTTTTIAKELGMSAKKLNQKLFAKGIQYKQDKTWVLYSKYQDRNYTETRTHQYYDKKGVSHTEILTVWTERGRAFIHSLFNPKLSFSMVNRAVATA